VVHPDIVGVFCESLAPNPYNGRFQGNNLRMPMASPLAAKTLEIPRLRMMTLEAFLTRLDMKSEYRVLCKKKRAFYTHMPKFTSLALESLPMILVLLPT
jgi:hypothetical protein